MDADEARARALDELDLSGLEDFESAEFDEDSAFEDDGRNSAVSAMWDRWGFSDLRSVDSREKAAAVADALVVAHGMCQSFVDTFSTDQLRYRVTFDPSVGVAGTDFVGKAVAISPSPVYDETLTPQQAGVILTGMAAHEVAHVRYGRTTAAAVRRIFGPSETAASLSNILDDVRIERRFAEEYPGYRDVFEPLRRYVGAQKKMRSPVSMANLANVCVRAVRLAEFTQWPTDELREERDWWRAWADRWGKEDSPRQHVEAVREGLRRIAAKAKEAAAREDKEERQRAARRPTELPPDVRRLRDGLATLPPLSQRAMRLVGEGRSGAEVAAALGVPVPEARAIVRDARRRLAGDLGERRDAFKRMTVRTAEDLDRALEIAGLTR